MNVFVVPDQMMAYWAESQGQSPVYAKYCTLPGQHCTHMYHDKHKAAYFPSPLCEQREPSCWTVPGSRTGGVLHDYTNWTNPDLAAPTSHFPFGLDIPNKQAKDPGHYHPQEHRERERMAGGSFRTDREREYELGMLNEGWQRCWEPHSRVADSSYRELQAWAARYSHSLPRRKRVGAEMKGAYQDHPEANRILMRGNRNAAEPNVAALQRTGLSSNAREQWDLGGQQKTITYNPPPVRPVETNKEVKSYQRRMFSQPPGYTSPPAYNGPHNSTPVRRNTFPADVDQEGARKTYCTKSMQQYQHASIDLTVKRGENEEFSTESQKQRSVLDSQGYEHQMQATDTLWTNEPIYTPSKENQPASPLSLQQSAVQEVHKSKATEGTYLNVIEGRKFKFNKKTGGATIFCLVSRISGTTSETPKENTALPHFTQKMSTESSEFGGINSCLKGGNDFQQMNKLADEVDFSVEKVDFSVEKVDFSVEKTFQSSDLAKHTTPRMDEHFEVIPHGTISSVESQHAAGHRSESQTGYSLANQSQQQSPVRYPLWREPGHTARVDINSSPPCCLKENRDGQLTGPVNSPTVDGGLPVDTEVRRLEMKEDSEPESCSGQLVIDTTSIVIRMELIPSPKKEYVDYLFQPPTNLSHGEPTTTAESNQTQVNHPYPMENKTDSQFELENGRITDPRNEDPLKVEVIQTDKTSQILLPCMSEIPTPEKETLKERTERILGIPLLDINNKQANEETTPVQDLGIQNQNDEGVPSPPSINMNIGGVTSLAEGVKEGEVEEMKTTHKLLHEDNNEDAEILSEAKPDLPNVPDLSEDVMEECEPQDVQSLETTGELHEQLFESGNQEHSPDEKCQPDENDASSSALSDHSHLQPQSPSDSPIGQTLDILPPQSPTKLGSVSHESTMETDPSSMFTNLSSELSETSTCTNQEPCSTSTDTSLPLSEYTPFPLPGSSTLEHPSLNIQRVDSSVHEQDSMSFLDLCEEKENELHETLQLTNNGIVDDHHHLIEDDAKGPAPQQPLESDFTENAECIKESIVTPVQLAKENKKDLTELEGHITGSRDNVIDSQSLEEVKALEEIKIPSKALVESCSQEEPRGETQETGDDPFPRSSVSQCLTPSLDVKDSDDQPSAFHTMPSLHKSTSLSDVSDSSCTPDLQIDFASLSFSEDVAPCHEPFLLGISETPSSPHLEPPKSLPTFPPPLPPPPPLDSPLLDPPRFTPPQEEDDAVPFELPCSAKDAEEPQYPLSLWDAVNRIRKHTAPDSENEDEEVSELWDPLNVGEDLVSTYVEKEVNITPEETLFPNSEGAAKATVSSTVGDGSETGEELVVDEARLPEVLSEERVEDTTEVQMQDGHDEEPRGGNLEEDKLSCSSATSHGTEDTVVKGLEEVEEKSLGVAIEQVTQHEERRELPAVEEEKKNCSDNVEEDSGLKDNRDHGEETDTYESDGEKQVLLE